AKAVLQNRTLGYRSHPQLNRFRAHPAPVAAINSYLAELWLEAQSRGYRFDARKLRGPRTRIPIRATRGQLRYEWAHLLRKLHDRAPELYRVARRTRPRAHGLFRLTPGPFADWEMLRP